MQIIFKKTDLELLLHAYKIKGKTIGFVPTMGALHEGHLSLIDYSKQQCDISICSVFVNPTQFNNKTDLEKYPRMPDKDAELLKTRNCDVLFMPTEEEIYPTKDSRRFSFGNIANVLEGAHRPGHFNGVAQVVSILFNLVKPDKAFFGLKDYQQILIINELVKQLKLTIEIVACPILREADGLAMSSRNMLLSEEERQAASLLPKLMKEAVYLKKEGLSPAAIKTHIEAVLSENPIYKLDYFSICSLNTLEEISGFLPKIRNIALIACFVGHIRLIDNIFID